MIATGKRMRKAKNLNRHELHKSSHAVKSADKIRRMGWTRSKH